MKTQTLDALEDLAIAISDVASLLLPNCVSQCDRSNVEILRTAARNLADALANESSNPNPS